MAIKCYCETKLILLNELKSKNISYKIDKDDSSKILTDF